MGRKQRSVFKRMLAPTTSKLNGLIVKGLLASINDTTEMQLVKVSTTENTVVDNVERIQPYGLSSVPPTRQQSEVIVSAIGANKDHFVATIIDSSTHRPKERPEGNVCLYDMYENLIELSDGKIEHTSDSIELNGASKRFVTHAELNVSLQTMVGLINSHTHLVPAVAAPPPAIPVISALPLPPVTLNISSSATTTIKTGG